MASFKSREVIGILEKLGYFKKRQTGSHLMMYHPLRNQIIPIPIHAKELKRGLLISIIKQTKSSEKEFIKLK